MGDQQMKVGVWFYGLGTALTGILDIAWGAFDASHQPIQVSGQESSWSTHTGLRRGRLAGRSRSCNLVAAQRKDWRRGIRHRLLDFCGIVAIPVLCRNSCAWLANRRHIRHHFRARSTVNAGRSGSNRLRVRQLHRIPCSQKRAAIAARWMLGLPPVVFGIFHLIGIRVFATIVPQWMSFGYFWAGLTGIAFILAGIAICSGIKDVLAARLLALMLLLFEGFVEIPPIFIRLHNLRTWGAAVYNLSAIGACWIFAEFLASRADRGRIGIARTVGTSRPDQAVA